MEHYQVIIVGGGPGGSACGWQLKKEGVECLVLERQKFPREKPCAGWLPPRVFEELDVALSEYPYPVTTFKKLQVSLYGIPISIRGPHYAIRRPEFDTWLLERSGVPVKQHHVRAIRHSGQNFVIDGQYSCHFLVGAGGTLCPVYQTFFKTTFPRSARIRIDTMEEEFSYSWQDENCYLRFFDNKLPGYSWYVPKKNGVVNVGVGGISERMTAQGQTIRTHWDHLTSRLANKGLIRDRDYRPRGYVYYLRTPQLQPRTGNVLLVGDALGLATRDMGEGIGPAIKSGILAAKSIADDEPYDLQTVPTISGVLPGSGILSRFLR